jgi:hypothetical protein
VSALQLAQVLLEGSSCPRDSPLAKMLVHIIQVAQQMLLQQSRPGAAALLTDKGQDVIAAASKAMSQARVSSVPERCREWHCQKCVAQHFHTGVGGL